MNMSQSGSNSKSNMKRSKHSLMFQLLIVVGILNIGGILSILWFDAARSGETGDVPLFSPTSSTAGGVQETIRRLEKLNISVGKNDIEFLPSWDWIEQQYGKEPVILGLERCSTFNTSSRREKFVAPAGMFNSGTNLLYHLMERNCIFESGEVAFSTPWGKHTPAEMRLWHRIRNNSYYENMSPQDVLPIVMVRHPLDWIQSTCEQPYYAKWPRKKKRNCPSLVSPDGLPKSIRVEYGYGNVSYESGMSWWNEWNRAYFDSLAYPRLIVRLEDLFFHPQFVLKNICTCAGGSLRENIISIPMESVKSEGHYKSHTVGFLGNIVKYGTPRSYSILWKERDLSAARKHLDRQMVETFHYRDVYEEMIV